MQRIENSTAVMSGLLLACLLAAPALGAGENGLKEDLWSAARRGDAAAVKALLAKGADVNAKSAYGATALSFACDKGDVEVVKILLANKAEVNVKDTFYKATPLSWAISKRHTAIVKLLIDAGAEPADSALAFAARIGDRELTEAVLKKSKPAQTVLDRALAAAPADKGEIRDLLIKAGAKAPTPAAFKVDAESLKSYVGTYRHEDTLVDYEVETQKDKLVVRFGRTTLYTLEAVDKDKFRADDVTVLFRREKDKVLAELQRGDKVTMRLTKVEARARPAAVKVEDKPVAVKSPANWPSFRGSGASGVADGQQPPIIWNAETGLNIRWKTSIPGLGLSCPVVWGERIFLTTAFSTGDKAGLKTGLYGNVDSVQDASPHTWHVLCLDKSTGDILWNEIAHKGVPKVKRHTKATHANSTCATDGRHVVACFGSEGLYCYDIAGKLLWKQELGLLDSGWFYDPEYQWGFGSSPIIYKNLAIVQCDAGKNPFIAAYELSSGKPMWKTPREEVPSWGTPTIVEGPDRVELVTNATKFVRGYDPMTGKELWRLGKNSEITVPTPFYAQGLIFVTSGYNSPRPIYAIRPGAAGDITLPQGETSSGSIAWSNSGGPYMPTPIVYGEHLYVCSNAGVVTCYDAKTGKRLWADRLGSDAGFTASPVAADGYVYFTSEDGITHVLKAGPTFDLVATNSLGDACLATPAISDGMIFIRTQRFLWGIGRKAKD